MIIESRAYARAGLLGNPSDGYFGKTISIIVKNFGAIVSLYQTPELVIEEMEVDKNRFRNIHHLTESIRRNGYYGGQRLIKAVIKRFCEYCEMSNIRLANKNFTIRYESSIPRQVGMAGSSAIVTATIRALMQFYDVQIPIDILPTIVLSAETEELSINAGLQDRVIQTYEGCVYMDFNKKHLEKFNHGKYERLPTEAEWEFVARGGNQSNGYMYSGSNNIDDVAWYSENSGGSTKPVGTLLPNALGIHDMTGNVWEWCSDCFTWNTSGRYTASAKCNPLGLTSGTHRILRGGSYSTDSHEGGGGCRTADRGSLFQYERHDRAGFRLVLSSD